MDEWLTAPEGIDVSKLMEAIQKKIKEKKESGLLKQSEIDEIGEMELQPLPDFLEVPNFYQPHLYPPHTLDTLAALEADIQETGAVKGVLKKFRKILMPLIRFMVRPIYLELKNAIVETQRHVVIVQQSKEYIKLLHNAINNMIVEFSKLKIDHEMLKTKIRALESKIEFIENRERAIEKKLFPS